MTLYTVQSVSNCDQDDERHSVVTDRVDKTGATAIMHDDGCYNSLTA